MVKKIALEEHFLCPEFIDYWNPTVAGMPAAKRENLLNRNIDFGEMRLASMDAAGISRAVLDAEDGSLDLMIGASTPLELTVATKAVAHWLTTALPLALLVVAHHLAWLTNK